VRAINPSVCRRFPNQRLAQWLARWLGKHRLSVRLAGCFLSVSFATAFAFLLCRMQGGPNLIWIANGVLLAYLLLAPRWRWPAYLAVGYAAQMVRELFTGAGSTIFECRVKRQQGDYLWVESVLSLVRNPKSGAPTGILNIVRDISARKQTELSREFHLSLTRAIHEVSLDGILVVNDEGIVASLNKRFQEVWLPSSTPVKADLAAESIGFSDEKLLPTVAGLVNDPDAFAARVRELYADPYANDQCLIELKDRRTLERYSTGLRGENRQYLGRAWFFRDFTKQQQAEERLRQAYHTVEALTATDPLTGLANRRRFDQCLSNEWRRGLRDQTPLSMLLIDVDLFKSYNDFYGHLLGDTCPSRSQRRPCPVSPGPETL
jgi:hypothetical protein